MKTEIRDSPRFGRIEITRRFSSMTEAALAGFIESSALPDVKGRIVDSYCDENGHGWCKFEWGVIE